MKQKNVLEKCVKAEKQEKKILEDSLFELKKRMVDLQEGPGGFADLSGMLERQARKFDEIKSVNRELFFENTLTQLRRCMKKRIVREKER